MKLFSIARLALTVVVAFVPFAANAQFSVVSQAGHVNAAGHVSDIPAGQLDSASIGESSYEVICYPPRCEQENHFYLLEAQSEIKPDMLGVYASAYASGDSLDITNTADISITFDVQKQMDISLRIFHSSFGLANVTSTSASAYFGRLLDDGSFESIALPEVGGQGYEQKQRRMTLQSGRYRLSSHIVFNPAKYIGFDQPLGSFVTELGGVQITQVPEPAALMLACVGLFGLCVRRRFRMQLH